MSAIESIDVDALSAPQQDFVLETAMADGLSVGANDAGELVVDCRSHDGAATVSMESVFALASRHELTVVGGRAHWDDETVELVVVDGDWQRDAEDGER